MRTIISTENAPKAIGPYNQGIIAKGNLLFTAGQIPLNPETMELVEGGIVEQTKQALKNLIAVVEAGGSSKENIVKTTCFLKDMNDFKAMNEVYSAVFTENPPARSAVEVARLPLDVLFEIECIALIP